MIITALILAPAAIVLALASKHWAPAVGSYAYLVAFLAATGLGRADYARLVDVYLGFYLVAGVASVVAVIGRRAFRRRGVVCLRRPARDGLACASRTGGGSAAQAP